MPRPLDRKLNEAVRLWQLYMGSSGTTPIKVQQRIYDRAVMAAQSIAKSTGMDLSSVEEALTKEASVRGSITPRPGQDY